MEKIRWHQSSSKSIDDSTIHLKLDASPIHGEGGKEPGLKLLRSDPGLGRGRLDENEKENEKNKDWLPLRRDVYEEWGKKNRLKKAIQQQPFQDLRSGRGAADDDDENQHQHQHQCQSQSQDTSSKGEEMPEKEIYGYDILRKLKSAVKKVADLRNVLYGKRLKLKERRNELRYELSNLSEADANFMKAVRQYCPRNNHHHAFKKKEGDFEDPEKEVKEKEKYYADMEQQRDIIGSLQYEYDQEEDEHDLVENQLLMEEAKLSMMVSMFLDQQQGDNDEVEALRTNPSSGRHHQLSQEEEDVVERTHYPKTQKEVAIEEYESRQGDARIVQERLADLLAEENLRRDFAKKRETLRGWGSVGESEEGDFAEKEFNDQFREMESELEVIEADVRRLKNGLLESGYLETSEPASTIQPEAASLFSLPPIEPPPPRIHAHSPGQVERKRAKSDSVAPIIEKEIWTARVRERRVSHWILVTFGSSPVEQWQQNAILRDLEVEVIGGEVLEEKKTWARTTRLVFDRLKNKKKMSKERKEEQKQGQQPHDELENEDESRSSWDDIGQQDHLSYSPDDNRASEPGDYVFWKGMLEVKQAVSRLEEQFPFPDRAEKKHDHTIPYGQSALRMDIDLEYESRSC